MMEPRRSRGADLIIRPDINEYEAEHTYNLDPVAPADPFGASRLQERPYRCGFSAAVFADSTAERSETPPARGSVPAQAGKRGFGAGSGSPGQ